MNFGLASNPDFFLHLQVTIPLWYCVLVVVSTGHSGVLQEPTR